MDFQHSAARAGVILVLTLSNTALLRGAQDPGQSGFDKEVEPLLQKYCVSCHGPDKAKAQVRIDALTGDFKPEELGQWNLVVEMLEHGDMPPKKAVAQPTEEERLHLTSWLSAAINQAKLSQRDMNGMVRRLTRDQYRRTLRDLLSLREDLGKILPVDAVSKDGFSNSAPDMQLSPLQMEYYFQIAEEALDLCIVDVDQPPTVQNFRIDLGENCNPDPYKERLILGANSNLMSTSHFLLTELDIQKPFPVIPFRMRKEYDFIEGWEGNATVRGMRSYDNLAHSVFCCFRGAGGYSKGQTAYEIVSDGVLLRPSKPLLGEFGVTTTHGPTPNFKISLRELPPAGDFKVHVVASRYRDHITLAPKTQPTSYDFESKSVFELRPGQTEIVVPDAGIYQLDAYYQPGLKAERVYANLGEQMFLLPAIGGAGAVPKELRVSFQESRWIDELELKLPGENRTLNLQEIELMFDGSNRAGEGSITGSPHYQNSPDWVWQNLIDGDRDTLGHSVDGTPNPWFKIDFDPPIQVDDVVIWNRPQFEGRLEGAVLTLGYEGDTVHQKNFSYAKGPQARGLAVLRLDGGLMPLAIPEGSEAEIDKFVLHRVPANSPVAREFVNFEGKSPYLGVHLGFRRDCGSSFGPAGVPQLVTSIEPQTFTFSGALNDFPKPAMLAPNQNYLAGVREIGIRSQWVDGEDMPRLRIHSVEFEGPFYAQWPPKTHSQIFFDSPHKAQSHRYAHEILTQFLPRAWRRPVTEQEISWAHRIWQKAFDGGVDFEESMKEALLAVLTSPQFLFLVEKSEGPQHEYLDPFELASKLSFFFWGTPPDTWLLEYAASDRLQVDSPDLLNRLMEDGRFDTAIEEFTYQWLQLDKFDSVEIDRHLFPRLDVHTRRQVKREPLEFMKYLVRQDLGLRHILQSDFVVVNDALAEYYGLAAKPNSGLGFVPIKHEDPNRGGLLSQAAILTGLSDGRESNPVKRGAWLARKIIAEPPADPPPNVPSLEDSVGDRELSLREKLELHRSQEGCMSCHEKIDPWGIPFETMDAGGLPRAAEANSTLPDGTDIANLNALKAYLADDRLDQVAFSFLKHLATYAIGRPLTYGELDDLKGDIALLRDEGYRLKDMFRFIATRDFFVKK